MLCYFAVPLRQTKGEVPKRQYTDQYKETNKRNDAL